jgi:hypothetical protein
MHADLNMVCDLEMTGLDSESTGSDLEAEPWHQQEENYYTKPGCDGAEAWSEQSAVEQLTSENERLARENAMLKREKDLAEANERLLKENKLLRLQCEEVRKAAQIQVMQQQSCAGHEQTAKGVFSDGFCQSAQGAAFVMPANPAHELPGQGSQIGVQMFTPASSHGAQGVPPGGQIGITAVAPGTGFAPPGRWYSQFILQALCPMQTNATIPDLAVGAALPAGPVKGHCAEKNSGKQNWENSRAGRAEQLFAMQAASVSKHEVAESKPDDRTTVMLRNLPNNYSRTMLLDLIDSEGFKGMYDFIYLPIDFTTKACLGYAFVNLSNHEVAEQFRMCMDGFSDWIIPSRKNCIVSWSSPHQGLEDHLERYRNSPVMHPDVPDECKPVLFQSSVRTHFPPPTKKLRAPRIRQYKSA